MNPPKKISYENPEKKLSNTSSRKNLAQSSSFNKHHFQINCKSQIKNRFSDLIIIKSLWNDLGVNVDFQKEFEIYYNEIKDFQEKRELINNEKNHLRRLREALIKLSEEISNRDNTIFKLNKYCSELDKYTYHNNIYSNSFNISNDNEEEIPSDLFELIKNAIKFYRINTANVINRIIKVREISSYYELNKKWDPSSINRSYSFDNNYILKMVNDLNFINNSSITNYILTNNRNESPKIDLFLSNWVYIVSTDNKKLKLSISLELQNEINKCKYIILQDKLLNKVKKEIDRKSSKKPGRIFSPNSRPSLSVGNNLSSITKKSQSEIFLRNDKDDKKFFEIFGHNKINLSRTLYYLKKTMGQKYENIFFKDDDINNDQKNMNIVNQIISFNNKNEDIYESNNENEDNKDNMNIMDNNSGIIEDSNKKGLNKINIVSSETNSDNAITERLNKNYEGIKTVKNAYNLYLKQQKSNKQRNKIKKKNKMEKSKSKEKIEKKEKKIKKDREKNITNKNQNVINNENNIIIKEETKEKEKDNKIKIDENINKKPEIVIKKFDFENIKADNIININIITETNKEKEKEKEKEINENNENNENNQCTTDKNVNNNTLFENDIKLDSKKEDNLEEENNNKDEVNQEIDNEKINSKILDDEKKEEEKVEEKEEKKEIKEEEKEEKKEIKEEKKEEKKEIKEEEKKEEKKYEEKEKEKKNEKKEVKKEEELEEKESKNYISISNDHSRISEANHISKNKLLKYRQYTEEEIKQANKEYDIFF